MQLKFARNQFLSLAIFFIVFLGAAFLVYSLRPFNAEGKGEEKTMIIVSGERFKNIVERLEEEKIIRSSFAFKTLAILTGKAADLKPGEYRFSSASSSFEILSSLSSGADREIEVVIPDGSSSYEIDRMLSERGIIPEASLIAAVRARSLEGKLLPDTYRFFIDSDADDVVQKFLDNFEAKAAPFLNADRNNAKTNLILASLVQNEVPDFEEQRIVAGIAKKRIREGIPLQVDATICFIKEQRDPKNGCLPITRADLKIDSPYNTYLYRGLPEGPIGNPGVEAIKAALSPKASPYWYYLSDPITKKTIFAKTLDEHNQNRLKYL